MKTVVTSLIILFLFIIMISAGCGKNRDNPCEDKVKPSGKFVIKEMIGDTAFIADTIFRDNYVQFQASDSYDSVTWKLGTDPREWKKSEFSLSFVNTLGTLPISFTGKKTPNTTCFPGDNGTYSSSQNVTIVEQVEKHSVTISPLVGRYHGYFTDKPTDTFTVRLDYFDSSKYDVSTTGSKNFYWFSNMPKGYMDNTSSTAYSYPELRNGYSVEMGYKCFVFTRGIFNIYLKGWLSSDTLYINYGNDIVGRRKFVGKKL